VLVVALLGIALTVPLAGSATADRRGSSRGPSHINLPTGFQPEGIAIGRRPIAYVGSLANGDIYAADLRTGTGKIISAGPGTPSVGLKVDRRSRLFVSGGPSGSGRVVSIGSGDILATYQFTDKPSFVNDVVLTRSAAWFTDSQQAQLYKVPLGRHGKLPDQSKVTTLPLTGDWHQVPDQFNANGIAVTPDRRALLVVQTNTGLLFRVNPRTGVATQVDLGGTLVTNGDGLLVRGRTLYVVRNQDNQVVVFRLNRSGRRGVQVDTLTSPDFDVPTTIAAFGHSLYLPSARFNQVPDPAAADYWITRIDRRQHS
jgi:sugar lactone lactonase YvrE